MDKAITTTFMIIVGVILSVMVFKAVYPAVIQSNDAMTSMQQRIDDRTQSQIEVVHAAGELAGNGSWQDSNGDGDFDVFVWVKNIGSLRIVPLERLDVFFGPEGNFTRIQHINQAGGAYPYWEATVENDTAWNPTATLKITIHYNVPLVSQRYFVKVVIPNGISAQYFFSM